MQIRFVNEEPYAIYCSEHSAGSAYYWDVVDFSGERPITYVAYGGHANYVTAGSNGFKKYLKFGNRTAIADGLRIGDVVERHVVDGDIALFNRQPSLHKVGQSC